MRSPLDFRIVEDPGSFYVLLFFVFIFFSSDVSLAVLFVLGDMHKYSFFGIDDPFFTVFFRFIYASYFYFFFNFKRSFWDPRGPKIFFTTLGVWQMDSLNFFPKY